MNKEKPILMSAPMVRAILEGRKTQTRRIVKPYPYAECTRAVPHGKEFLQVLLDGEGQEFTLGNVDKRLSCRIGNVGDKLWVRENCWAHRDTGKIFAYCAEHEALHNGNASVKKIPSIHMPRIASRITLEITGIRVERLNAITEQDARAEGFNSLNDFKKLWAALNGDKSWDQNPFVWVIEFRRIKP